MRRMRTPIRSAPPIARGVTGSASAVQGGVRFASARLSARPRRAFTLVEMLVVLVIIVTLIAIVVGAMQRSPADRINGSARQLQSQILLSRSIAARDQRITGIRLVQSANDPWVVDTIEQIASPGFATGTASVQVEALSSPPLWRITNDTAGEWPRLFQRNLIRNGLLIEIPAGTGRWYQLQNVASGINFVNIVGHYTPSIFNSTLGAFQPQPDPDNDGVAIGIPYRLELAPISTPGEEPLRLQPGTVIDLAGCRNVPLNREILFSPGNGLSGNNAANGNVYLYLTTLQDVELTRNMISGHPGDGPYNAAALTDPRLPIVPANIAPTATQQGVPRTEPLGLAIYAQTGNVMTFAVDLTDVLPPPPGNDLMADLWYSYGRSGREAGR